MVISAGGRVNGCMQARHLGAADYRQGPREEFDQLFAGGIGIYCVCERLFMKNAAKNCNPDRIRESGAAAPHFDQIRAEV